MFERLKYLARRPLQIPIILLTKPLKYFRFLYETEDYMNKANFEYWFAQKVLNWGGNKAAYWPVHWSSKVHDPDKIVVGIDAYPGYAGGCYITGRGGLEIGDYTQVAPNVVIVTANHDPYDARKHVNAPVSIGKYCWIGGGAKIMPGVTLGDWTIVGAGAVVTRSFPEGHCIIGGVPAVKIKDLDPEKCIPYAHKKLYNGYIPAAKFAEYRKKKMKI